MDLKTKFDLGQEVFSIYEDGAFRIVKCLTCNCTGKVTIGDEEFNCPKCDGKSAHRQYAGQKWFVSDSGQVGQIRYEITGDQYCGGSQKQRVIQYMLDSTGIVSGTLHNEEDLFASEAAAQSACDERNLSLKPDEIEIGV